MTTKLFFQAITKFILGVVLVGLLMGILFVPMFFAGIIMMFRNPELLKKRLRKAGRAECGN